RCDALAQRLREKEQTEEPALLVMVKEARTGPKARLVFEKPKVEDAIGSRTHLHEIGHQRRVALAAALGTERILVVAALSVRVSFVDHDDAIAARLKSLFDPPPDSASIDEDE